jgi:hypothetical protein
MTRSTVGSAGKERLEALEEAEAEGRGRGFRLRKKMEAVESKNQD